MLNRYDWANLIKMQNYRVERNRGHCLPPVSLLGTESVLARWRNWPKCLFVELLSALRHARLFVSAVHLNLEPHVSVSVRCTTAVGRNMTRWVFLFLWSVAKLPWVDGVNQCVHHRWHSPVTHHGSQQNAVNSTLHKVLRARAPLKEFGVGMGDSMIPIIVCDKVIKISMESSCDVISWGRASHCTFSPLISSLFNPFFFFF